MNPEDLVARLAPVRIPESFARFGVQDALAAIALGLVAALLLASLLRRVTVRKLRPADRARASIAELRAGDPRERIAGLARLLRAHGGTVPEGLSAALYDPRATIDATALERAVLDAARRR